MERAYRLIEVVQQVSLASDLAALMRVVRTAARELVGSDGATFVLRDGDRCHYADEDAIEPLWKGLRFPMSACISGWAMLHREPVEIEDIYADERIPAAAYRPTFVKSLVMVPIRSASPIGAIGNYWARHHRPSPADVRLLQALADSTSIAMEKLELYADLERRVRERTDELHAANAELEAFAESVSHDLRAPLRSISGFARILLEDHGDAVDAEVRGHLDRISASTAGMSQLIDDLLRLARETRADLRRTMFDLSRLAHRIAADLARCEPDRGATFEIADGLVANADTGMIRVVLENLLGNAWKFTRRTPGARITVGTLADGDASGPVYFVRDNGAGFDMAHADRLFKPFRRLHRAAEFEGTGIGLATVARIIRRHGGRIWAESTPQRGATFFFTLP